jgi:hypothetical protein
MKYRAIPFALLAGLLLLPSLEIKASEIVGIYAIVDRVVLEPNPQSPDRIQIWGVIATNRDSGNPKRGYLYFRLPAAFRGEVNDVAKKEWADIQAVAGTGQAIAFGQRFFPFVVQAQADAYASSLSRVRPASEKPKDPDPYPVNIGVSKITDSATVTSLRKAPK